MNGLGVGDLRPFEGSLSDSVGSAQAAFQKVPDFFRSLLAPRIIWIEVGPSKTVFLPCHKGSGGPILRVVDEGWDASALHLRPSP